MTYLGGAALAGLAAWQFVSGQADWPVWKLLLALLVALDLGAGAVANALPGCVRFYHAAPLPSDPWLVRQLKNPRVFALLHAYPLLVGWLYGPNAWGYGLGGYAALAAASLGVCAAAPRVQRPLAYLLTVLAIGSASMLPAPAGFDWLLPVLFLKIVAGHCVQPDPAGIYSPPRPRPLRGEE